MNVLTSKVPDRSTAASLVLEGKVRHWASAETLKLQSPRTERRQIVQIKESLPGETHLTMVSSWPAYKLHIDFVTNPCTQLQASDFTEDRCCDTWCCGTQCCHIYAVGPKDLAKTSTENVPEGWGIWTQIAQCQGWDLNTGSISFFLECHRITEC